ncbi:hypothetical protein G3T11_10635, partial [Paenibacillus elgii]|nr:hypothetical protein [Paenibacillus elgii]
MKSKNVKQFLSIICVCSFFISLPWTELAWGENKDADPQMLTFNNKEQFKIKNASVTANSNISFNGRSYYTYTSEGKLMNIVLPNGDMEEFKYDANGNLITRARNKFSNLNGRWSESGGTWTSVGEGKQGEATTENNVYYLNSQTGSDFVYEGDIKVVSKGAGALVFRANSNGTQGYVVNVDTLLQVVRLWDMGSGKVIRDYPIPIGLGQSYHLKVVTKGSNIKVYLNDGSSPVMDVND